MELPIQRVAAVAGTTSRTLRHYGDVGILPPSRVAANGTRYYDEESLLRLQRILLLRQLGLGLAQIAEVLARRTDEVTALALHRDELLRERDLIDRRIAAVETTMAARERKEPLVAQRMFDGFDHTQHREEVVERWGESAYARSDAWWRGMDDDARAAWRQQSEALARDWRDAHERGVSADSEEARTLAARHAEWLGSIPGTPSGDDRDGYLIGLGDLYVAEPRFAANYGGERGAGFVRDALRAYVGS